MASLDSALDPAGSTQKVCSSMIRLIAVYRKGRCGEPGCRSSTCWEHTLDV